MDNSKRYNNLTDQQLLDGMGACYYNSLNHFETGIFNAKNFGLGVALFVISIEELIKANAILHCYIGLEEQETINIAFNSRDKHRARLKMALGLGSAYGIIEKLDFIKTIEQKVESADIQLNINSISDLLNPEWLMSLQNQIQPLIQDDIANITNSSLEIKSEFDRHTSWFLHAQNLKEKGLYADLNGNKWESPLNLNQDDYEEALSHTKPIIEQVGNPIRTMVEASQLKRDILRPMIKQFIEMAKTDYNN